MFMLIDDGRVIKEGVDFLTFDNIDDALDWATKNDYVDIIVVKFAGFV